MKTGTLLIAACAFVWINSNRTAAADYVFWTESDRLGARTTSIIRANLDGTGVTALRVESMDTANSFGGLALDPVNGHIYCGDKQFLFRVSLDGSSRVNLFPVTASGQSGVSDVEIDLVNQKIYWIEAGLNRTIHRADLDGSNEEHLFDTANSIEGIALDPGAGKVYMAQDNPPYNISVMNLDGSGRSTLYTFGSIVPFDVETDPSAQVIYWSSPEQTTGFYKADLTMPGASPVLVADPAEGIANGFHFDTRDQKFYFSSNPPQNGLQKIQVMNADGTGLQTLVTGRPFVNSITVLHEGVPNQPPICDAGAAQVVEAQGPLTSVQLNASGSSDPDGDVLDFEWSVAADSGAIIANPSSAITSGSFPVGPTLVTMTVSDGKGGVSVCDELITVVDTAPPVVVCTTDIGSLFPPDRAIHDVNVFVQASDLVTSAQNLVVQVTARSNEPDDFRGTGVNVGDVNGGDGFTTPQPVSMTFNAALNRFEGVVQLRAERDSNKSSRVYSITAIVTDSSGNPTTASCVVVVPRDGRR